MVHCVAVGCKNSSVTKGKSGKKVSFFKFPNDERREAWVKAVNRKNWTPSEFSQLCSDHFSSDQVISLVSGLRMRENAVPNIFSTSTHSMNSKGKPKRKITNEEVEEVEEDNGDNNKPSTSSALFSPTCYVPNCTSKEALMFNGPKDADLRRQWESIIGRTDGRPLTEADFVCEAHFMKSMFQVVYEKQDNDVFRGVKKLVDEAVPTIFPNKSSNAGSSLEGISEDLPSTTSHEPNKTKGFQPTRGRPSKRKCCVPNCTSIESPSITLHRFPALLGRCKTWLNHLNMSNFKLNKMSRVCSKHFASSSFSSPGVLKSDAVPKLYSSSNRKLQQESDPDSLLSEAQKTAVWLQSVKRKREDRKHKKLIGPGSLSLSKKSKVINPWNLKDCDVVISEREKELASAALPQWEEYEARKRMHVDVPRPIVEIKEEPPDVMELVVDDLSHLTPLPPPAKEVKKAKEVKQAKPLKPILPKMATPSKLNPPPLVVPPVITSNNLVFQTTLRSASEVKSVQNQPLPPSTIYRVIIPTSVQGHTIEPSSILEQLKDKISAMHQEKLNKSASWGSPQVAKISIPSVSTSSPRPASQPTPLKLPLKPSPKTTSLKSDDPAKKATPSSDEHGYASKPNQSSWPILLQTPVVSPAATPVTTAAATSSTTPTASTSSTVQISKPTLIPVPGLRIPPQGSDASPIARSPIKIGKINSPNQPILKKVSDVPLSVATFPPGGTLNVVPNLTKTGLAKKLNTLSAGTQTNLAFNNIVPHKNFDVTITADKYRSKIKVLKQSLKKTTSRLEKATKELEEYKCLMSLIAEREKGKENVIVIEATDKCECFAKRKVHEDVGDVLKKGVKRRVGTPAESRALVLENEKLMKRIEMVKKKLKQKEITRVVVFQAEELLPMG